MSTTSSFVYYNPLRYSAGHTHTNVSKFVTMERSKHKDLSDYDYLINLIKLFPPLLHRVFTYQPIFGLILNLIAVVELVLVEDDIFVK